jgi:hypothetical protein
MQRNDRINQCTLGGGVIILCMVGLILLPGISVPLNLGISLNHSKH